MNNPTGDLPQLPSNLRDKLDQLTNLVGDLRRELIGTQIDPVDDTRLPFKKPINQDNISEIIDALGHLTDPFIRRSGLKIEGVELTQSTQYYNLHGQGSADDSDNMVPLVAGKDLILRAYVERRMNSLIAAPDNFSGVVSYRGKQISPLNGPQRLQAPTALRRHLLNDSLNFRIPAADCHGTVNFTVRVYEWHGDSRYVNPNAWADNYNTATYNITANFYEIPRMKITGVLIHFTGNGLNLAAPTGVDLVNTAARFLPMIPTPGFDYNVCSVIDSDLDLTVRKNWDKLLNSVTNLRNASTTRTFFVGLLPDAVATLKDAAARGIGNSGVAVASKDDTRALSHELGHGCQLMHVDFNSPEPPLDNKYPKYAGSPFASIGEEGIDTARLALYSPNFSFDFMTYNENGPTKLYPTSTWISPYHYKKMMYAIRGSEGTGDFGLIAVITVSGAMLLNFRAYRDGKIEILPSYPVMGLPKFRDSRPDAGVRVELYDRQGEVIDSYRCHSHNPYQDPEGPYLDFHEVLPWPEAVGEIVFIRDRHELARLPVGGATHEVQLEAVRRLEQEGQDDVARVEWSVSGHNLPEEAALETAALIRFTHDGGRTWQAIAADLREAKHVVNLDLLPGGEECRFQLIVSSGLSAVVSESETFTVRRKPRRVHIVSPEEGQAFCAGEPVVFAGAGHSPDFGTSADDEVNWTSSVECCGIGAGSYIVRDDLPVGTHRITLVTPDGQGGEASASVRIKVREKAEREKC